MAQTQLQIWKDAVSKTETMLIEKMKYKADKAHEVALKRNKHLHPANHVAVTRNMQLNHNYIMGVSA